MSKNIPWEKKEKLYIALLAFSVFTNMVSLGCIIYIYRAMSAEMAVVGLQVAVFVISEDQEGIVLPNALEAEFNKAMLDLYRRTRNETSYKPTMFYNMLIEDGGLNTALKLLSTTNPSSGYLKLWELNRLDLTVEAFIWDNPKFHELFSQDDLKAAQKRLTDYGYLK